MSNPKTATEPIQRRSTFVEPSEAESEQSIADPNPKPLPTKPTSIKDETVALESATLSMPAPPKPAVTTREATLDDASEAISQDREAEYGEAQENFGRIAGIWTSILGLPITEKQVALMMAGLKLARLAHNEEHHDSWVDLVGYGALGSEVSTLSQDERNERAKGARA